jgi:hypothetical protein
VLRAILLTAANANALSSRDRPKRRALTAIATPKVQTENTQRYFDFPKPICRGCQHRLDNIVEDLVALAVSRLRSELQQIRQISIQILEDRDGTVRFLLRLPHKDDILSLQRVFMQPWPKGVLGGAQMLAAKRAFVALA